MEKSSYLVDLVLTGSALLPDAVTFIVNRKARICYARGDKLSDGASADSGKWSTAVFTENATEAERAVISFADLIFSQRRTLTIDAGVDKILVGVRIALGAPATVGIPEQALRRLSEARVMLEFGTFDAGK